MERRYKDVPSSWRESSLLFFGGKGGVGKTTCAAATALRAAEAGRSTLLISTDPAHSTADMLSVTPSPEEREVLPGLWLLEIDADREAERYLAEVRQTLAGRVKAELRGEVERQLHLARLSPGAQEAALFDRLAAVIAGADERYSLLVVDTAPSGHTLRLLSLPEVLEAWLEGLIDQRRSVRRMNRLWRNMTVGGSAAEERDPVELALLRRRRKFAAMRERITDESRSAFMLVLTPERLPILETEQTRRLLTHYHVPVGGLIVNRVLPGEASDSSFLRQRRAQETVYRADIERRFCDLPILEIPLQATDVTGPESLRGIAAAL
ncbi:MAG: ArsA family ATPase [Spirochaetales bacterium]|nr:ArsA family ATPase [Spirochaetales bacterium]